MRLNCAMGLGCSVGNAKITHTAPGPSALLLQFRDSAKQETSEKVKKRGTDECFSYRSNRWTRGLPNCRHASSRARLWRGAVPSHCRWIEPGGLEDSRGALPGR